MDSPATDIARRLAASAEAVCRRYLSNGRREGRYWLVGDVHNSPGRSLYVRLSATTGAGEAQANGQTRKAATMAIFSTSSPQVAPTGPCARRSMKPARFLSLPPPAETKPAKPDHTQSADRHTRSGTAPMGRIKADHEQHRSALSWSPVDHRSVRH